MDSRAQALLPAHPVDHTGPGTFRAWNIPLMMSSADPADMDWAHRLHRSAANGTAVRLRPGAFVETASWNDAFPRERHLASALCIAMTSRKPPVFARETAFMLHRLPLSGVPAEVKLRASSIGAAGRTARSKPESSKRALFNERRLAYPKVWTASADADRPAASLLLDGEVVLQAEDLQLSLADGLPLMPFGSAVIVADAVLSGRRLSDDGKHPRTATPMSTKDFLGLSGLCLTKKATAAFERVAAFASPSSESPGESRSRVCLDALGFQPPELQHKIHDAHGTLLGVVDFWWKDLRLAGEFDGKRKYTGGASYSGRDIDDVIREEKRRMERIQEEGVRFVRWMWEDLTSPRRLMEKLTRAGVPRTTAGHRRFNHSHPSQP